MQLRTEGRKRPGVEIKSFLLHSPVSTPTTKNVMLVLSKRGYTLITEGAV